MSRSLLLIPAFVIASGLAFSAAPARAAGPVVARLAQPVASETRITAGGAIFLCKGDSCTALAPTSETYSPAACRAVAAATGLLAGFGDDRRHFDPQRLAACNTASGRSAPQVAAN